LHSVSFGSDCYCCEINIQWVEGDYYRKLAKERTVKNFVIPANKGNIYSSDGSLLATSILIMKYVLML
jgi:cell division protein FtsI/penicillin-binding protein 2